MREKLAPYKGLIALGFVVIYLVFGSVVRALGGPMWLVMVVLAGAYFYLFPSEPKPKK